MSNSPWDVCSLLSPGSLPDPDRWSSYFAEHHAGRRDRERKELWSVSCRPRCHFPLISLPTTGHTALPKRKGQEVCLTTCRKGTDLGISVSYKMATSLFAALWCHFTCFSIPSISQKREVSSRTWFNSGSVILAKELQRLACVSYHITSGAQSNNCSGL